MYQFGNRDGIRRSPPPQGTASSGINTIGSAARARALNSSSEKGIALSTYTSSDSKFTLPPQTDRTGESVSLVVTPLHGSDRSVHTSSCWVIQLEKSAVPLNS